MPNRVASRPVEQEPLRPAPVVGTSSRGRFWARLAAVAGPGLVVAFADTEDVIVAVFDARREVVFCVDRGEIPAQV